MATSASGFSNFVPTSFGGMMGSVSNALTARAMSTLSNSASGLSNNLSVNRAISDMRDTASSNTSQSMAEAALNRDWQVQQNRLAMEFSSQEAAKNRDWQQYMSNTAHQREVKDLQAAGLNPVLSASGGNGAAVTSGSQASGVTSQGGQGQVDTSANQAIVTLLASMLSAQNQMEMARLSATTQQSIADKNIASAKLLEEMRGLFGLQQVDLSGRYSNRSAEISGSYGLSSAREAASASRYASDAQERIQSSREAHDIDMAKRFPTSWPAMVSSVVDGVKDLIGKDPLSVKSGIDSILSVGHQFFDNVTLGWLRRFVNGLVSDGSFTQSDYDRFMSSPKIKDLFGPEQRIVEALK